jgi:hypothetical protein
MSAYAVVGPTNLNPRDFSSLASALDPGVTAGTSAIVFGGGATGSAWRPTSSERPPGRSQRHPGVGDGRLDLRPVADDSGVTEQPFDVAGGERGHGGDGEPGERLAEVLPLAQDDQPGQAGLERLQRHPLEDTVVTADRAAPLVVVVGDVVGRGGRPRAADRLARRRRGSLGHSVDHGAGRVAHRGPRASRSSPASFSAPLRCGDGRPSSGSEGSSSGPPGSCSILPGR